MLTGFGIVDANAALAKAGQLMKERHQGSQVPLDAHFGGGAAAVPAAPVAPRGDGQRVVFLVLALLSLAVGTRRGRPVSSGRDRGQSGPWTTIDDYSSRVLDVVDAIPPGQVMSYGDIAEYLGRGRPPPGRPGARPATAAPRPGGG